MVDFGEETRRRTSWWRDRATGGSAGWISGRRRDDAHPGGETGPQEGQHGGFRGGDETTHDLVARQGHGRVNRVDFGEEMRRHTSWWRDRVTGGLAAWISGRKRDDALPGGKTGPRDDYQDEFREETRRRTY